MLPHLLALGLACWTSVVRPEDPPSTPTAPDGQRGFGAQPSDDDLRTVFQAREGPDAEFIAALEALEPRLRERLLELRDECEARGFDVLLRAGARGDFELLELHARFTEVAELPGSRLAAGDDEARALAAMLLDERFRARVLVLADWEQQARELRRGLAVLAATTEGYVVLSDQERGLLGPRVDLAASFLRALGNDLSVLAPRKLDKSARRARAEAVEQLIDMPHAERRVRLEQLEQAAERMSSLLFSARLAAREDVVRARAAQAAALDQIWVLRKAALQFLPGTPEGRAAPPEIARLRKHERLRMAGAVGLQGLSLDPLDEVCAFAAASAEDFAWGPRLSRPLFDRYLALRGIRTHDHLTLKGRRLTPWEQQALAAVTAGL